jgi:SH3-like domain-containing protein
MFFRLRRRASLLLLCLCACPATATADSAAFGPSGKPVPRYESLKYGEVNARLGPSLQHRVLWTYHRRGLPVRVIAESDVWRQVSDPDGDVSWINTAQLAGQQTVFVTTAEPLALHSGPQDDSRTVALLGHGVVAALEECRGGWRKLKVGEKTGWAPLAGLWGAERCEKAAS